MTKDQKIVRKVRKHFSRVRVHNSLKVWKNTVFFTHFWKSLEKSGIYEVAEFFVWKSLDLSCP